jgi:hypothetical protein
MSASLSANMRAHGTFYLMSTQLLKILLHNCVNTNTIQQSHHQVINYYIKINYFFKMLLNNTINCYNNTDREKT